MTDDAEECLGCGLWCAQPYSFQPFHGPESAGRVWLCKSCWRLIEQGGVPVPLQGGQVG